VSEANATREVAAAGAGRSEPQWARLSVRMLAVHPVIEFLRALPAIIALLVVGSQQGHGGWWSVIGVGVPITLGLVRWATTRYRITPEQIQVRRGLLRRSELSVPRDRVRTVDLTSHFMHRLLGLTRATIGTGQSDRRNDSGLVLDGLTAVDAARLREELLHTRSGPAPAVQTPAGEGEVSAPPAPSGERVVAAFDPSWVRFAPFTLSGLVSVGVALGFITNVLREARVSPERFGPLRAVTDQLGRVPVLVAAVEVLLAGLVVVSVFSVVGYVLAFWGFRLTRSPHGTLHAQRGLITTRSTTIEERRLRGVELSEPLLLRAVRGARAIAITTGLRAGRGSERGGTLLAPPSPRGQAERVAALVLGDAAPLTGALTPHPPAARRRRFTRVLVGLTVIIGGLAVAVWLADWPVWIAFASLVLLPIGPLLAVDRYASLGHARTGRFLVFRQGSLVRRRYVLATDGVIGWTVRQSFFQRRAGLVTLIATTAAGRQRYELLDVEPAEAVALADAAVPGLLTPFLAPAGPAPRPRSNGA
jgi:putative membrane protein